MKNLIIFLFLLNSHILFGETSMSVKYGVNNLNVKITSTHKTETIILLHGGPGVPDEMTKVKQYLSNDYNVITFQQRGTGESFCNDNDFSIEAYISDINVILGHFKLKKVHVFGHSWGGLYAQIYAQKHPEKVLSLFLCSPSSGTNETWKATEKEVMSFNKKNATFREWTAMGWYSLLGMMGNDNAYRNIFTLVINNYNKPYTEERIQKSDLPRISSGAVNKTRKSILNYPHLKVQSNTKYKIIITYGEFDIYGDSKQEVFKRFPEAEIINIKNTGHIPWHHDLISFQIILSDFYLIKGE